MQIDEDAYVRVVRVHGTLHCVRVQLRGKLKLSEARQQESWRPVAALAARAGATVKFLKLHRGRFEVIVREPNFCVNDILDREAVVVKLHRETRWLPVGGQWRCIARGLRPTSGVVLCVVCSPQAVCCMCAVVGVPASIDIFEEEAPGSSRFALCDEHAHRCSRAECRYDPHASSCLQSPCAWTVCGFLADPTSKTDSCKCGDPSSCEFDDLWGHAQGSRAVGAAFATSPHVYAPAPAQPLAGFPNDVPPYLHGLPALFPHENSCALVDVRRKICGPLAAAESQRRVPLPLPATRELQRGCALKAMFVLNQDPSQSHAPKCAPILLSVAMDTSRTPAVACALLPKALYAPFILSRPVQGQLAVMTSRTKREIPSTLVTIFFRPVGMFCKDSDNAEFFRQEACDMRELLDRLTKEAPDKGSDAVWAAEIPHLNRHVWEVRRLQRGACLCSAGSDDVMNPARSESSVSFGSGGSDVSMEDEIGYPMSSGLLPKESAASSSRRANSTRLMSPTARMVVSSRSATGEGGRIRAGECSTGTGIEQRLHAVKLEEMKSVDTPRSSPRLGTAPRAHRLPLNVWSRYLSESSSSQSIADIARERNMVLTKVELEKYDWPQPPLPVSISIYSRPIVPPEGLHVRLVFRGVHCIVATFVPRPPTIVSGCLVQSTQWDYLARTASVPYDPRTRKLLIKTELEQRDMVSALLVFSLTGWCPFLPCRLSQYKRSALMVAAAHQRSDWVKHILESAEKLGLCRTLLDAKDKVSAGPVLAVLTLPCID